MPLRPDLGAAGPEELCDLLGSAYAVAFLLPPALHPDPALTETADGASAALWLGAGVDAAYVVTWLRGEADRLEASMSAPVAPPLET